MTPAELAELTRLRESVAPPPWGLAEMHEHTDFIIAMRNALPELLRCAAIVGPLERLLETRGRVTIQRAWHPKGNVSIRLGHVGEELFIGPDLAAALASAEQAAKEGT